MGEYKYQLRQGSTKDVCPSCGRRSFTPYIDGYGTILSSDVGRCDHQQSCTYHYTPSEYFKAHGSPQQNNVYRRRMERKPITYQPPPFINPSDMTPTLGKYEINSLMLYLHSFFDGIVGHEEVNRVAAEMAVGTSKQFGGSPVFWLIDQHGKIRDGKIMGYDPLTGKRVKEPRPLFNWVHCLLKDKYQGNFKAYYFNSHALNYPDNKDLPLWIFESEKAALIVAIAFAWGKMRLGIPIATGGCEAFNPKPQDRRDPYNPITLMKRRTVVFFPDEGKYQSWKEKASTLRGYASEVYVSTVMERNLHSESVECDIEEGDALDDLLLRYFSTGKDVAHLLLTSYLNSDKLF